MEILEEAKNRLAKYQRIPEDQTECDEWHEKYKDWSQPPKKPRSMSGRWKSIGRSTMSENL